METWGLLLLLGALSFAFVSGACTDKKQTFEETGKKADQGIQTTGDKIDQGLNKTGEAIEEGFDQAGQKIKDTTK